MTPEPNDCALPPNPTRLLWDVHRQFVQFHDFREAELCVAHAEITRLSLELLAAQDRAAGAKELQRRVDEAELRCKQLSERVAELAAENDRLKEEIAEAKSAIEMETAP